LGGDRDGTAARRLIGVGIAAYGPTALTGVHDWADSEPGNDAVRRSGLAHAVTNGAALALYAASLAARRRGNDRHGKLLGLLGAGALGAGGYLGGHLVFAKGIGPDQTTFDAGPADWTDAAGEDEVSPEMPTRVIVGDTPVLLVEHEGALRAIHDRCSHRGCSLADGSVESGEVVCPCHGSRFRLEDGGLVRGPATTPQPAFDVRRRDGRIELRLAQAD
jgi:nitrite reductase/ring-hydroxylating ferredoxin subunit